MLVLSRKKGQSLMIGEIEVMVIKISGGYVSIGIDAPKELDIRRKEKIEDRDDV